MPDTLSTLLDARAVEGPAAPALVGPHGVVSYAELADESRRLATGLERLGIARGDRVAIWLPNVAAWLGYAQAAE